MPLSDEIIIRIATVGVIAMMALGVLKTIGFEYFRAVCWHNLRLEVQRLRRYQEQRLQQLHGEVDVIDEPMSPSVADPVEAPVAEEVAPAPRQAA